MITGISTHFFAREPLTGAHLDRLADAGFDTVELFANSHQIDFDDPNRLRDLARAVDRNRLAVNTVHAPFYSSLASLKRGQFLDLGTTDADVREMAVQEISRSFVLATLFPVDYYVLHFPDHFEESALLRSVDALLELARELPFKLCFENIPGTCTDTGTIARFLDQHPCPIGICYDIGHAHLNGRAVDDIRDYGVHFYTAHIHDNDGRSDAHMLPGDGNIPWDDVMHAFRTVDYKWGFMLEIRPNQDADPTDTLIRAGTVINRLMAMEPAD